MERFVTIEEGAATPVLLWEIVDGRPRVQDRFESIEDVPDVDAMSVHAFREPTTLQHGRGLNTSFYPGIDRNGAPFWKGARVTCVTESPRERRWGRMTVEGAFLGMDAYGFSIDLDQAIEVRDAAGTFRGTTDRLAFSGSFRKAGDEPAALVAQKIDIRPVRPHDTSDPVDERFVEIVDDPRSACDLVREPTLAIAPSP